MSDFAPPAAKLAASTLGALAVAASPTFDLTKLTQGAAATGSLLRWDGTNWAPTSNIILDDTNKKITLGGDWSVARSGAATGTVVGTTVMPTVQPTTIQFSGDTVANWYRSAAGVTRTDGSLAFTAAAAAALRAEQTATNIVLQNSLLAADANPSFKLNGDGKMQWGAGGASAADVSLARFVAGGLQVQGGGSTQASLSVDAVSGSNNAQLTLIARNAGAAKQAQIYADTAGNLVLNTAAAGTQYFQVGGATTATLDTAGLVVAGTGIVKGDLRTSQASLTTARTGGAAAALPANPVRYLAMLDENGNRMYVPAYS